MSGKIYLNHDCKCVIVASHLYRVYVVMIPDSPDVCKGRRGVRRRPPPRRAQREAWRSSPAEALKMSFVDESHFRAFVGRARLCARCTGHRRLCAPLPTHLRFMRLPISNSSSRHLNQFSKRIITRRVSCALQ